MADNLIDFRSALMGERPEQEKQVQLWQGRYKGLLAWLTANGTVVYESVTLVHDVVVEPHDFIQEAVHMFVFPPQKVELTGQSSQLLYQSEIVSKKQEVKRYEYDKAVAEALITVRYEDSTGRSILTVSHKPLIGSGLEIAKQQAITGFQYADPERVLGANSA